MPSVFFSYSHKDEDLRDRLEVSLAMLQHEGLIEAWHDRRITTGDELNYSISEALEQADLILLLVSPDFLASRYCYHVEMKRAIERHRIGEARIIPIILRPCDWKASPLSRFLATPKDGKPITKWPDLDEAFQDVVESIRAALPTREIAAIQQPIAATTPVYPMQSPTKPRSSNLRLAKKFSEADHDHFLDGAFNYIADFFEGSLKELEARNPGADTTFRRIDANRFTAVIYRSGESKARCKITLGGAIGNGIAYSHNDREIDNSFNETLSVISDAQGLYLKPMGMNRFWDGENREQHLTYEGAAEYYWSILIKPLQSY